MSLQSEVDAKVMAIYNGATVADLERGIANCEKWAIELDQIYRPKYGQRMQRHALLKYADLLRAELKSRQAVKAEAS